MLLCGCGNPNLCVSVSIVTLLSERFSRVGEYLASLALALVYRARLHEPHPVGEGGVEEEVGDYGGQCVGFRSLPAKFPVVVEECASNGDGGVA